MKLQDTARQESNPMLDIWNPNHCGNACKTADKLYALVLPPGESRDVTGSFNAEGQEGGKKENRKVLTVEERSVPWTTAEVTKRLVREEGHNILSRIRG
jgi:hypothetical protein